MNYIQVLTIAGSDSGGGAGIQADLKTFSALGCFGSSVITAVTAQNTLGVRSVHGIPATIIKDQLQAVLDDIAPVAIKIGMINRAEVVDVIETELKNYAADVPVILDPVMVATSGHKLIAPDTVEQLIDKLFPIVSLVTPNIDEAVILGGQPIHNLDDMIAAGKKIIEKGAKAVLVKGGHLIGPVIYDVFICGSDVPVILESTFIASKNLHGTGCTLSSAIAAEMAKGKTLLDAIKNAKNYISRALQAGSEIKTGEGNGPLNHFFEPLKLIIQ
ncbi:bifunctional hydroxymethylpyrimidine kinase/phosphomethylpyrimidine kinase [Pedobacter sp. PF22-3]|uniref:bifunctional hydroxymethylpyrimidine kinase/phosphomethylpyrimidine kinase n=1 Tax=Pedobacter sp. PF22-3 TaxID=2994467 RepID=UPI0022472502|nr:bifunctional hydroxymethylpyrimidine kinase/phosphomethylpyrimidine kinase [Pedobacter sp. PF22-3]MCX2495122.1 bifunctional hydroxymethylpyrimidine kinase/phosphomethylpyrimidine kinase [Pedobacter sp. PF22-3]